MCWIEYRPGEDIPKELYYDGYQTDKDNYGWSPLMFWIIYRPGEAGDQQPIPQ